MQYTVVCGIARWASGFYYFYWNFLWCVNWLSLQHNWELQTFVRITASFPTQLMWCVLLFNTRVGEQFNVDFEQQLEKLSMIIFNFLSFEKNVFLIYLFFNYLFLKIIFLYLTWRQSLVIYKLGHQTLKFCLVSIWANNNTYMSWNKFCSPTQCYIDLRALNKIL